MTAVDRHWTQLRAALDNRRAVWVTYHGHQRLLCPHALGTHHGHALVLAYQTGGHTSTGRLDPDPNRRWRCLRLDQIDTITTAEPDNTWASSTNYNPAAPFPNPATTINIAL